MTIEFKKTLQLTPSGHLQVEVKVSVPKDQLVYNSRLRLSGDYLTPYWGEEDEDGMCYMYETFTVDTATCSQSLKENLDSAKAEVEYFIADCQEEWEEYRSLCKDVKAEMTWFIND